MPHRRTTPITAHAVIFDCDGTLVATQGVWDRAYATLFTRHGATLTRADRHRLVGLQLEPLGQALAKLLHLPGHHRALAHEIHDLVATNLNHAITPMPGAIQLVTALAATRPLAVASNTPSTIVRHYLTHIGIADAFTAIIGIGHVAHPKPAADTYLAACHAVRTNPAHAVAIEDSPTGVAAARAAGMTVIGIPSSDLTLHAHHTFTQLDDPPLWHALGTTRTYRKPA